MIKALLSQYLLFTNIYVHIKVYTVYAQIILIGFYHISLTLCACHLYVSPPPPLPIHGGKCGEFLVTYAGIPCQFHPKFVPGWVNFCDFLDDSDNPETFQRYYSHPGDFPNPSYSLTIQEFKFCPRGRGNSLPAQVILCRPRPEKSA